MADANNTYPTTSLGEAREHLRDVSAHIKRCDAARARQHRKTSEADVEVSAALYALRDAIAVHQRVLVGTFCDIYVHEDTRASVRLRATAQHGGTVEHVSPTLPSEAAARAWIAERRHRDGLGDMPEATVIELHLSPPSGRP